MATTNPFDLLGDDDSEDPTLLIAAQQKKVSSDAGAGAKKAPAADAGAGSKKAPSDAKPAKLPSKPLPPSQAVREARNESGRGVGGRGYGRGRGAGGGNRELANNDSTFSNDNGVPMGFKEEREKPFERRGGYGAPRASFHGGRRGGFNNEEGAEGERSRRVYERRGGFNNEEGAEGERSRRVYERRGGFNNEEGAEGERHRRVYERRSGTGRGSEVKRDGAGRGNWGTPADEIAPETEEPVVENESNVAVEKQTGEEENIDAEKENPEKEPEEKQMTLEEYEKVREEKRKNLLSLKSEERKVDVDKEFESMQLVSKKKNDDEVFIKMGSDKDKRKEAAEKEERAKKSVSINEFLKPGDGETFYRSGGRGRGRGRGRGGYGGGYSMNNVAAPSIEDPSQFPSLGAN